MKKSKLLVVSLILFTSLTAWTLTPEQVKKAYEGCKSYLTLSEAKKKTVAKRAGIPVATATRSCQKLVDMGLKKALKYEAEYQKAMRAGCPRGYYSVSRTSCCPIGSYPSGKMCYYPSSSGGGSGGGEETPTPTPTPEPTPAPPRCEPAGAACGGFTNCCGTCADLQDGMGMICR